MACKITNCFDDEGNFDTVGGLKWLNEYKFVPVAASVIYLALVYTGRKWMEKRPRYDAVTSLTLWNSMLAIFSLFGLVNLLPTFINVICDIGVQESMCKLTILDEPRIGMWFMLFVLSKMAEFGDTLFIVLRKSNLQFLHWYHHITVLLYSWFALANGMYSAGYWFATVNFSVHVLMYTYFALRSIGIHISSSIAMLITVLQIVQMFIGLTVNFVLYKFHLNSRVDCFFDWNFFYITCGLYGSYALLFVHFFCKRYVLKKPKRS